MRSLIVGNLVALLCMVLWATSFPATDILLRDWHPMLLVPARLVPGTLAILLITLLAGQGKTFRTAPWRVIFTYGGLGMGAGTLCIVWGQDYSDAVTVSIILTTMPLVSAVMGYAAGSERVTTALAFGIVFAIAGGVLISLKPETAGLDVRGGEVLALAAVILWAWFARGAATRLVFLPDLARAAYNMAAASVTVSVATALALAFGAVDLRYDVSPESIGLVLWVGIVANGLTMVFWMTASRLLGVTVAAIHLNGVPFYVILMALAVGGTIYTFQVWGACLVAAGALLAQLPARKRGPAAVPLKD